MFLLFPSIVSYRALTYFTRHNILFSYYGLLKRFWMLILHLSLPSIMDFLYKMNSHLVGATIIPPTLISLMAPSHKTLKGKSKNHLGSKRCLDMKTLATGRRKSDSSVQHGNRKASEDLSLSSSEMCTRYVICIFSVFN